MPKQKNNNKEKNDNTKDKIIQIILIIIIIILLLHSCSLRTKKSDVGHDKVNIINITDDDKCQKDDDDLIDCLKDEKNSKCLVPNFVGKNKKDVLKWLSSISNVIEIEIKTVEKTDVKDGTVLEQSVVGISIKDLITGKKKLIITIVNNGSLTDCENSECGLPNFVGDGKKDVEDWLNNLTNHVNIKYVYVDSDEEAGTILSQSIESGTSIKDILDKEQTIIIYISNGKKKTSSSNKKDNTSQDKTKKTTTETTTPQDQTNPIEPSEEPEPELDDDFYVNDKEIARWENESNIKIFEDSTHISKVNGKIAPESKGTYKFVVNNGTNYNLKYIITFTENNQHNMNMKYKLKKGNTYLIDHYVSYDELNIDNMNLNSKKSEDYYLEWKWVGDNDSEDTTIGNNAKSNDIKYNLHIKVEAESI